MSGTLFGRASDVVVRKVLRSPLHGLLSHRLLIITVTGRRTGRRYSNPVGYAQHDGALLVGSVAGWRRNLRPGELVPVRLRGADVLAAADVITDEERAAEFYRVILPRIPVHVATTSEFTSTPDANRTVPNLCGASIRVGCRHSVCILRGPGGGSIVGLSPARTGGRLRVRLAGTLNDGPTMLHLRFLYP